MTARISSIRHSMGLSIRQMAERLAVSHSYYHKVEQGQKPPSHALLVQLERLSGENFLKTSSPEGFQIGSWFLSLEELLNPNLIPMEQVSFNELNANQRAYLRNKWSVEVKELTDKIADEKGKLANRLKKTDRGEAERTSYDQAVTDAQSVLSAMETGGLDAAVIATQQAAVAKAEQERSEFLRKAGLLSDEEAILEQVEINDMERVRQDREQKITELDALG